MRKKKKHYMEANKEIYKDFYFFILPFQSQGEILKQVMMYKISPTLLKGTANSLTFWENRLATFYKI